MAVQDQPAVVQGDGTVLLEVHHARHDEARAVLQRLAVLARSPEHVQTWRIDRPSLWAAAEAGLHASEVLDALRSVSRYALPPSVVTTIRTAMGAAGAVVLEQHGDGLRLRLSAAALAATGGHPLVRPLLRKPEGGGVFQIAVAERGHARLAFASAGWPLRDNAGVSSGEALDVRLRDVTVLGRPLSLRTYQAEAVAAFVDGPHSAGGQGVVVLPCGSGKTLVALAVVAILQMRTLVLTSSVSAARQWIREALDKTTIDSSEIGEYSGQRKELRPLTVATYSILSHKRRSDAPAHHELLAAAGFGLVVLDEVQLLPAPAFRATAALAPRRLGLSATLVREDDREREIYGLVGPRVYELPWRALEDDRHIAEAVCREVRVALPALDRARYDMAAPTARLRVASTAGVKIDVCRALLARHPGEPALVVGRYLSQLEEAAAALGAPLLTGETSQAQRDAVLAGFREGRLSVIVMSSVGTLSLDLPDAAVAVQLSGSAGSRQEEAQRLGRLLRPKAGVVTFYSVVARDTVEQVYARHRQMFLAEQGYAYEVLDWAPSTGVARSNVLQFPGVR